MRYGILADIHANLQALRAVLTDFERRGVDRYLMVGDLVGYGPHPNECVELVAGLDAVCVAGNHDLMAVDALGVENCGPLGRVVMAWTREALGSDAREFLSTLPLLGHAPGGVVLAHGALGDCEERIESPARAAEELQRLSVQQPGARVLATGHTHHRMFVGETSGVLRRTRASIPEGEPILINPGAIGQSREVRVRAQAAILDLEATRVTFRSIRYDTRACRLALRERGLPERAYHDPVSRFGPAGPPARRALRRARGWLP